MRVPSFSVKKMPDNPANPSGKTNLRRQPSQERSRRRFAAIVDGAAHVFAEVGFEAATTEAIAAQAQTSIGSVYQFFPSKLAIFEAVAAHCLSRSRLLVQSLFSTWTAERPWVELVDAAIDGMWAYHRSDPAVRAILRNLHLYGTFAKADQELMQEFIGHTRDILLTKSRGLSRARAKLLATMVVNVISALLLVCEREDEKLARKMIAETKVLLRRYLKAEQVFIS